MSGSNHDFQTAIQNGGLALSQYLGGLVAEHSYRTFMLVLFGFDFLGLTMAILLYFLDKQRGGALSAVDPKVVTAELAAEAERKALINS